MIRQRIYNPAQLTAEELKASFIVRQHVLEDLVGRVREQEPRKPCQHLLILGQRGMGKTTLGLRLLAEIRDTPELAADWQPVPFHEESYGIGDLADFWLTALRHLSGATNDPQWKQKADELGEGKLGGDQLAAYALSALRDFCAETDTRLILFVENLDSILAQFGNEDDAHALRATLIERPEVLLIGTANRPFEAIRDRGMPLYEFFREVRLDGLDSEETSTMLRALAEREQNTDVLATLESDPGRIETGRQLTGGNPRLIALTYRLLAESPMGSVREDLERLIDEQTPYFKSRIEDIPAQARRIFHVLADRWTPLLAREIAKATRLSSSHVSAQLKQLVESGLVHEVRLRRAKKVRYQIAERFYNIYYILRYSRSSRRRLERLIEFLRDLFGPAAMPRLYRKAVDADPQDAFAWAGLGILLKRSGKETEAEEACRKAVDADPQFARAWDMLGDILERSGRETEAEEAYRKAVDADPQYAFAWCDLGVLMAKSGRETEAEEAYRKAVDADPQYAFAWSKIGQLLGRSRETEAQEAYRRALEIDPDNSLVLNNLAWILCDSGDADRLEEADELARRAVEVDPIDANSLHTLSDILRMRGERSESIEMLKRAVSSGGVDWVRAATPDLMRSIIDMVAHGAELEARELLEDAELVETMEPLWHALRLELGEEIEPLPAEIMDAVKEVGKRIAAARQELR